MLHKVCASFHSHRSKPNWSYSPDSGTAKFGSKSPIFLSCMTLKFDGLHWEINRASLLCYFNLFASYRSHLWIQTGLTVRKPPIRVKIGDFSFRVTLKFEGQSWKIIGQIFYAISSCEHHFIAIYEFKLELKSGKVGFWPLWPCVNGNNGIKFRQRYNLIPVLSLYFRYAKLIWIFIIRCALWEGTHFIVPQLATLCGVIIMLIVCKHTQS